MGGADARKTIVLGEEHDDQVRDAVGKVLQALDAKVIDKNWGLAGSQEIETLKVEIGGWAVSVVAETSMGISISGAPALVDDIAQRVRRHAVDRG